MTLSDTTIHLLLDDGPWTDARWADLAREMGSEEDARRLVAWWTGVDDALRARIDGLVPDRTDLVLLGLERCGRTADLSTGERARLDDRRSALENALRACPALDLVVERVDVEASDFDVAWAGMTTPGDRRVDRPAVRPVRMPLRRTLARIAVAASVVAFAAMVVLIARRDQDLTSVVASSSMRTVHLADGSEVRLMTGAELTFRDEDGRFDRKVTLVGKGYFNVRPDETPFRVMTPSATVTVLGTKFGVESGPDETNVVLVDGRVAVAPPGAPDALVVLEPGQRTRIARGDLPAAPDQADLQRLLDWTRLLFFRSTPLGEAAATVARAYDVRVEVDPVFERDPVNGTFDPEHQGVTEVLEALVDAFGGHVEVSDEGTYRLLPR